MGLFYHGYTANEGGDFITHTAEAFTQFLLNVLYLDIRDEKSITMVEDAAEHLGNWCPQVLDWYDWKEHRFLSYFLGTKSRYHCPPYDFESPRHFRVLQIAAAAYDATKDERYLELCIDYCDKWAREILAAPSDGELPMRLNHITQERWKQFWHSTCRNDWRFSNYYKEDEYRRIHQFLKEIRSPYHLPSDLVMTWLEVYRHVPREQYRRALQRVMRGWIELGADTPSQVAGIEPHCGVHLPKYRDFTGDASLDGMYLERWHDGSCSYLLTGQEERVLGAASAAEAVLHRTIMRNSGRWGQNMTTEHACNVLSNAGTSSAYVAPALFIPVFGGLNVHFGRAPWVNVLYYSDGRAGLPPDVAALYVPDAHGNGRGVKLANAGSSLRSLSIRPVTPGRPGNLFLLEPAPKGLIDVTIEPGEVAEVCFQDYRTDVSLTGGSSR